MRTYVGAQRTAVAAVRINGDFLIDEPDGCFAAFTARYVTFGAICAFFRRYDSGMNVVVHVQAFPCDDFGKRRAGDFA